MIEAYYNSNSTTLTHKQKEVVKLMPLAIKRTGSNISDETMLSMSLDIENQFKETSIDIIQSALKKGALGEYGQTYKLTTQVICIWIREEVLNNSIKTMDFDFDIYLKNLNILFDRDYKVIEDETKKLMFKALKTYTKTNVWYAMNNCKNEQWHEDNGYRFCTPEYFTRLDILGKHGDKILKPMKREYSDDEMIYPD